MTRENNIKVDEIDKKIISLLKENGRIQNNDIAQRLQISEGTVRNRIKKLIDSNYLTIKGMTNPSLIKEKVIIFLGIQLSDVKNLEAAADHIKALHNVVAVYMVTGRFDLLMEIFIEPSNMLSFLSDELAKIDYISSTESFVTLKSYNKWL